MTGAIREATVKATRQQCQWHLIQQIDTSTEIYIAASGGHENIGAVVGQMLKLWMVCVHQM